MTSATGIVVPGSKQGERDMATPPADIADEAPLSDAITPYDEAHFVVYLRLLDAEADGADWREAAKVILRLDPAADPEHARRCWESHLQRARWMAKSGYRRLLEAANAP